MSTVVEPCSDPARFLDAQRAFYRDDPHYVPPLTWFDRHQLDRDRHPFFEHADCELFLARRGGEIVGRVSATRDRLHDEFHGDRIGFFGHFEARDEESAHAVLGAAIRWARERGATAVRGPVDLSTNYRCGLLVDGQEGQPYMGMPHNPRAYAGWIESFGFAKAKDLVAILVLEQELDMDRVERIAARARARLKPAMRHVDVRRFDEELNPLWSVYQDAWEKNWGFVPMAEAEFRAEAAALKHVIRPELTYVAEIEGRPVGIALGVPDVARGIKACNGRLLPFGWWRFMRTMKRACTFRTLTLGVVHGYRGTGLDALLLADLIRSGLAHGFGECEASWILEDNVGMRRPLELIGGRVYRTYRIYERAL